MLKSLRKNEYKVAEKYKQAIYQVTFIEEPQSKYYFFWYKLISILLYKIHVWDSDLVFSVIKSPEFNVCVNNNSCLFDLMFPGSKQEIYV
jgi:hypothetical protein